MVNSTYSDPALQAARQFIQRPGELSQLERETRLIPRWNICCITKQ